MLIYGVFVYKLSMYYKPTLFRADVREIAHGLIIRSIRHIRVHTHLYHTLTHAHTHTPYLLFSVCACACMFVRNGSTIFGHLPLCPCYSSFSIPVLQSCDDVVMGRFPASHDMLLKLGALRMQFLEGDYDFGAKM